MEHRTGFRNASTRFLHPHKFSDRAREMSRERSRGQPATIEIGPVEPREWNAPGSHDDGFACEHPRGIREGSTQALKSGRAGA